MLRNNDIETDTNLITVQYNPYDIYENQEEISLHNVTTSTLRTNIQCN